MIKNVTRIKANSLEVRGGLTGWAVTLNDVVLYWYDYNLPEAELLAIADFNILEVALKT